MSTVTKCTCGHEISQHTYSEDFTGCDVSSCNCMLDLGELIDKYQVEVTDRTEQNLKDAKLFDEVLSNSIVVERNYDALQTPMPCGHLARYAVNEKDGTQYCLMCDRNALIESGQKALDALENRNALFEKACLFLAYSNYGVNADKFVDLPADVQSFVLGFFGLEVRP